MRQPCKHCGNPVEARQTPTPPFHEWVHADGNKRYSRCPDRSTHAQPEEIEP